MDKEKILTIFLGLLVGGLLAGGYFASSRFLPLLNQKGAETIAMTPKEKTSPALSSLLTISSPDDFTDTSEDTVTVIGKSLPNAKIVIFANADEQIIIPAGDGSFSIEVKLENGENEISVTALDPETSLQTTLIRTVVKEISK